MNCVCSFSSTTRFVVTLAGASDEYTNSVNSDLDEEEEGGPSTESKDVRALQKTLLRRNSRFNNRAVEAAITTHQVVKQDDDDDEGQSIVCNMLVVMVIHVLAEVDAHVVLNNDRKPITRSYKRGVHM